MRIVCCLQSVICVYMWYIMLIADQVYTDISVNALALCCFVGDNDIRYSTFYLLFIHECIILIIYHDILQCFLVISVSTVCRICSTWLFSFYLMILAMSACSKNSWHLAWIFFPPETNDLICLSREFMDNKVHWHDTFCFVQNPIIDIIDFSDDCIGLKVLRLSDLFLCCVVSYMQSNAHIMQNDAVAMLHSIAICLSHAGIVTTLIQLRSHSLHRWQLHHPSSLCSKAVNVCVICAPVWVFGCVYL